MIKVIAFYHFADWPDYAAWREPIRARAAELALRGTVLLAAEGINSTIAGPASAIDAFFAYLQTIPGFAAMTCKTSVAETMPFQRLKIRLKKEIVTLRQKVDPKNLVGTYIKPSGWNELIKDPDVLVVDTRNDYEVAAGSFPGAINPNTASFGEFPAFVERELLPHKDRPIAMFCTGGIRCEKSTAYLRQLGFSKVFHLQGGILQYLEDVPRAQSLWQGECFVFDEREALGHGLTPKKTG